jgi:hypothetical protein
MAQYSDHVGDLMQGVGGMGHSKPLTFRATEHAPKIDAYCLLDNDTLARLFMPI